MGTSRKEKPRALFLQTNRPENNMSTAATCEQPMLGIGYGKWSFVLYCVASTSADLQ